MRLLFALLAIVTMTTLAACDPARAPAVGPGDTAITKPVTPQMPDDGSSAPDRPG